MTYPDKPTGLQSVGFFTEPGKDNDAIRERLAAIGMQWFNHCQSQRSSQERQWHLNLAFYGGNQNVQFKSIAGNNNFDLYVPKAPYWRVRIVVNQVRRVIRKEIARLTAQKPNAFVVPSSSEDADVFAAQAGEQIWDSLWRKVRFNKTLREAIFWQSVTGTGFVKSYWDATKADPDSTKTDPVTGEETPVAGDIVIHNVSPFHLFVPDLLCSELEDQPYIIHAIVKNNSWIKQNFGIDATDNSTQGVDQAMQNALNVQRNNEGKDQSVILEVWVKPGYLPELPNGGMFTIANKQIVQGFSEWPYDHGQYPFSKIDAMPTGKFYAASVIEDLIPLQRELNRSRSQLIESKNRMSKPQLLAEQGSVNPKAITSEPGQVILYAPGLNPPSPLPLQNLPSYVTDEINRLYTDIQDISGQHDVSNGSTPPGVTAATAISFLQEQDESLISTHFASIEEAIEKVAGQTLNYVKMYWDEPRTIKTTGIDSSFDVQTFRGADLRGNVDIRIEAGSALPTSRAAKQAFIMDLMKMGFIDPNQGLELLEVGGLQKIYERIRVDRRQAQRENLKMRVVTEEDVNKFNEEWAQAHPEIQKDVDAGLKLDPPLIVTVNTYDNHEVHIQVHNDYRKSQNFEMASPMTKALFEEHVRQHMEALSGQMTHPLTGMDPSNPNAPSPDDEDAMMQDMEEQGGQEGTSGPEAMPQMDGEAPPEGAA